MNDKKLSVEQMCRDLLEIAIRDGLVGPSAEYEDPDPQCRSGGEMCGMANLLLEFLNQREADRRALWLDIYTASMKSQMSNAIVLPGDSPVELASVLADLSLVEYDERFTDV